MSAAQKFASFAIEDLKEGSNLFDNVDGPITDLKLTTEAPDNYTVEGNPIFAVLSIELAGTTPVEERRVSQSYSLGASAGDNFTISEDGYSLIPTNDDAAVRKDSKFGTLMQSFQNEGVPATILKSGVLSALIGLNAHWKRVADKERSFADDKKQSKKSKFPPSTLVCTKVIALPGVNTVPTTTGTTATATTAAASGPFDLDTATFDYLSKVLVNKGGKVQRSQLTLLLSQAAMKDEHRQEIAKRGTDESFLVSLSEAGVIKYDPASKPQTVLAA